MKKYHIDKGFFSLVLIVCLLPLFLENSFHYEIIILTFLNAVTCIGLNMLVGYTGQISLGHAAFSGLGAYISVILSTTYGLDPVLSILVSCLALTVLAYVVAKPILKLEGHYLAMATLALGMIIYTILKNEEQLTGGTDGMGVAPLHILGFDIDTDYKWYALVALFLLFSIWALQNLIHSPFGRVLKSIRDSEITAKSVGVEVTFYKTYVFVLSVVIAAVSGSFYAFYSGFISPAEASFVGSIQLIVMIVFGGLGRVYGALVGAAVLTILPQLLTSLEDYEHLIYGAIIIFTMVIMPKGLVSLFDFSKKTR